MYIAIPEGVPLHQFVPDIVLSMQMSICKDKGQILVCKVSSVAHHSAKKLTEDDNLPPPLVDALYNSLHVNAFDNIIGEFYRNSTTRSHAKIQSTKAKHT